MQSQLVADLVLAIDLISSAIDRKTDKLFDRSDSSQHQKRSGFSSREVRSIANDRDRSQHQ
jgi:hypothetical protein